MRFKHCSVQLRSSEPCQRLCHRLRLSDARVRTLEWFQLRPPGFKNTERAQLVQTYAICGSVVNNRECVDAYGENTHTRTHTNRFLVQFQYQVHSEKTFKSVTVAWNLKQHQASISAEHPAASSTPLLSGCIFWRDAAIVKLILRGPHYNQTVYFFLRKSHADLHLWTMAALQYTVPLHQ